MRATSVLANAKSKAHQDASSKAAWPGWKAHVLTQGDLLEARARAGVSRGHSSEDAERKPGGAKGRRNDCKATREPVKEGKCPNVSSPKWGTTSDCANPNRPDGAAILSARGEANRTTCGTREEDSDAGDNDDSLHHPTSRVNPRSSPIAGCGKPHVRWCRSPGGRNIPSGRPDQAFRDLHVEAEFDDVAVAHDVIFSFDPQFAGLTGLRKRTE